MAVRVCAVSEQRIDVYNSAECEIVNVWLNFHIVSAQCVCVCVVVVFRVSVTDWASVFVTELINYVHCRTHTTHTNTSAPHRCETNTVVARVRAGPSDQRIKRVLRENTIQTSVEPIN